MHITLVGAEFEENLAVRYLQGALERAGHRVTSIVFNEPEETERVARRIVESKSDVTGLSMVFTYRAREFATLAARARELGYRGHIVAGGHFAALHAHDLLADEPAIDSVARGEGEAILLSMSSNLDKLDRVDGLVRRHEGNIIENAAATKPADLDTLAWPPRKSPFDHYLGIPITNILSSRGCSRNCAFCSIAAWHRFCGGDRLRLRDPQRLADEMASLYRQGVRIFNFHDDNFILDDKAAMLDRLSAWAAALESRGVMNNFAFAIKCRPDVVDRELFSALVGLGMFRVFLGIEAGTETALRHLGRGQTVADNVRALSILEDLDVHTCFNLLAFNPESTLEDFADNVSFLRAHPRHAMNFCRTEIYTGTPLERRLRKQGRLLGDYWGYDYVMADPLAQTAFDLIYPAFEARNYGEAGLHHLTMQIDYEHQLLRRFFGPHDELRRRVKELIVRVNLNTCDHLERVVENVPRLLTGGDKAAFGLALRECVERDNASLGREVSGLLDEIRWAPLRTSEGRAKRTWVRAAATAGLAAAVALAVGCREKSHATEMAAAPPQTSAGPPPSPPDAAIDVGADAEEAGAETPPSGPAALVKPRLSEHVLKMLAEKVKPAEPVELELWIDDDGNIGKALVLRPKLSEQVEQELLEHVRKLTFPEPTVRKQRFVVYFSKEEIAEQQKPVPVAPSTTHMKERIPPRPEMAPRPPPRPEMAPMRPKR